MKVMATGLMIGVGVTRLRCVRRWRSDGSGMQSWWQGPREMALYFYGPSARRVQDVLAEELPRFPLAQRSRVVPLPLTMPSG